VEKTPPPHYLNLLEISGSINSSEEEKGWSGPTLAIIGPYLVSIKEGHVSKKDTHNALGPVTNRVCIPLTHTQHSQVAAREMEARSRDCLWGIHVGRVIGRLAGGVRSGCTS
jgi:hypothetical protein